MKNKITHYTFFIVLLFSLQLLLSGCNIKAEFFCYIGKKYFEKELYAKALEYVEEAISTDPDYPEAYFWKASIFYEISRYDEAIEYYTICISLDPTFATAYFNRALCYQQLKQYESAVWDFERYLYYYPCNYRAYYLRGRVYEELDMFEYAKEDYTTACMNGIEKACIELNFLWQEERTKK
jgi:tetratricopeptide (TPR) repeat protein